MIRNTYRVVRGLAIALNVVLAVFQAWMWAQIIPQIITSASQHAAGPANWANPYVAMQLGGSLAPILAVVALLWNPSAAAKR